MTPIMEGGEKEREGGQEKEKMGRLRGGKEGSVGEGEGNEKACLNLCTVFTIYDIICFPLKNLHKASIWRCLVLLCF